MGKKGAKYLVIGEAPGKTEDHEGIPFVGDAGRKLDQLLALAKIDINDCYITNVCKCRPPHNRTPTKKEIRACLPWLLAEIRAVGAEMVITLGGTPLNLFTNQGISKLHGTLLEFDLPDDDAEDGKRLPREPKPVPKPKKEKKARVKKGKVIYLPPVTSKAVLVI
jgi:DNA polymerase